MNDVKIDKVIFFMSISVILIVCIPIVLFPEEATKIINQLYGFITTNLGFLNIWTGLVCIIIAIWFIMGRYGNVILGNPDEGVEFSKFSWACMLFCAGIGSGVMYWGSIEWAYYYTTPPFDMTPGSWEAAEMAATYGIFHWGPIGWAMYALPSLPIAYSYYARKDNVYKISESLREIFGNKVDGIFGKVVDILFMFGAVGATATSLGLGTPLIAAGISKVTGISVSLELNLFVLFIVITLFSMSSYIGLKKGIQVLSNINVYLMFGILIFILLSGPTLFIVKMGTTSIGLIMQNFFRMATWMDPVMDTGFPESWTVFYWAWWIISSPLIGLFIARISRGKRVKDVVFGSIVYGSLGCTMIFMILGNLGLNLQITGQLDVVNILNTEGAPNAIISILDTLSFSKIIIALFSIAAIVFTATTFDSVSYILATVTTKKIQQGQEPARWNRLFWAFALGTIPASLLIIEGPLTTIQTVSIVTAVPVIFIMGAMIISFVKMVDNDQLKKE